MFWATQEELIFMSILKKFTKLQRKNSDGAFSGKVADLQYPNLLKWNLKMSVFHGGTEIIIWCIFQNSY